MLETSTVALSFVLALTPACPGPAQADVAGRRTAIREPKTVLLPAGPGEKPFNVTRHTIPLNQIEGGGPPRDGIPAILHPIFVKADRIQNSLRDSDRVLGVFLSGTVKAYPVQILNYHELVNDSLGDRPILVSW